MSPEKRALEREAFLRELDEMIRPRRPRAEVVAFPDRLSQQELCRRQLVIDATWRRTLDAKAELERQFGRGFHRGFGED
jgi:hypothetical protein